MKSKIEKSDKKWVDLFGAWDDEPKTAEEIISEIKDHRISNREMETFD